MTVPAGGAPRPDGVSALRALLEGSGELEVAASPASRRPPRAPRRWLPASRFGLLASGLALGSALGAAGMALAVGGAAAAGGLLVGAPALVAGAAGLGLVLGRALAAGRRRRVFIVGRGHVAGAGWDVRAVVSNEELAAMLCTSTRDFVAPVLELELLEGGDFLRLAYRPAGAGEARRPAAAVLDEYLRRRAPAEPGVDAA